MKTKTRKVKPLMPKPATNAEHVDYRTEVRRLREQMDALGILETTLENGRRMWRQEIGYPWHPESTDGSLADILDSFNPLSGDRDAVYWFRYMNKDGYDTLDEYDMRGKMFITGGWLPIVQIGGVFCESLVGVLGHGNTVFWRSDKYKFPYWEVRYDKKAEYQFEFCAASGGSSDATPQARFSTLRKLQLYMNRIHVTFPVPVFESIKQRIAAGDASYVYKRGATWSPIP